MASRQFSTHYSRRLSTCAAFLCALLLSSLCFAAPKVQPPLLAMRGMQIAIIEGQVLAIDSQSSIIDFEVKRLHGGTMPLGRQRIRMNADSAARLHGEIDYILGVLAQVQDLKRPGQSKAAKVAELFVYDGAAPAIWLAGDEIRALFAPEHVKIEKQSSYASELLAKITSTPDPQLADLYSAELLSNQPLRAALSARQSQSLLAMSSNLALRAQTRTRILLSSSNHALKLSPAEISAQAQRVLAQQPLNSDESFDSTAALTLAALTYFVDQKEPPRDLAVPLIERFIDSDHAAILEQSARILLRIAPERLEALIQKRLRYSLLPRQSRALLVQFQKLVQTQQK